MLSVTNVELFYGAAQALRNVSLDVPVGKVTCLMGRNGVGKTTLLRAIAGHLPVTSGAIRWNDQVLGRAGPADRARMGFGYVPQGRDIFPFLTVRENLETGFAAVPRAHRVVQDEILDLFPILRSMFARRGGDLSGGQQQQLAIARALVMRPKLLILDEPTEGIQPSIIKDIANVIKVLRGRGEMGILLVEQYYDFAKELADRFAVMDRGEVVLAGDMSGADEAAIKRHLTV